MKRWLPTFLRNIPLGLLALMLASVLGAGVTFLGQAVLGVLMPADAFGQVRVVYGYALVLMPLIGLGLPPALMKLCSSGDEQPLWLRTWWFLAWRWLPLTLVVLLVLSYAILQPWIPVPEGVRVPLVVLLWGLPFLLFSEQCFMLGRSARARGRTSVMQLVSKVSIVIGMVLGGWLDGLHGFAWGFFGGNIVGCLAVFVLLMPVMRRLPWGDLSEGQQRRAWRGYVRYGSVGLGLALLTMGGHQAELIILGQSSLDATWIGAYSFVLLLANAVLLMHQPVLGFLIPEMTERHGRLSSADFWRYVWCMQGVFLGLIVVLAVGVWAVGSGVLLWIMGAEYAQALPFLPALCARVVLGSAVVVVLQGLFLSGRPEVYAACLGGSTAIAVALSVLLLPVMGLWGLVLGKAMGDGCLVVLTVLASRRCVV